MHRQRRSSDDPTRLVMLGPSPEHPGGITKVVASWRQAGIDRLVSLQEIHTGRWDDPRPRQAVQFCRALASLLVVLLRRRVDVVYLHVSTGASAARKVAAATLARTFGVPFIVQIHSGDYEGWVGRSRFGRVSARFLFQHAAASVVVAERWRGLARRLGSRDVTVLPNALAAAERRALAAAPADRPRRPTILYYGRWSPLKGPDRIAAALAAVAGDDYEVRLFGNGDRAWIERCFEGVGGTVSIGGWIDVEAKASELARATVLVVPSRAEGFGQVLLEARAAGVPVIASDVGAIADVLDGYAPTLLIPPRGEDELAAALARVIAGDWPGDRAGPSELPERFRAEHAVRELADLVDRIAARRSGPRGEG